MILQNCNVELTKVHYYDVNHSGRNLQIATISRDEPRPNFRKNTVIKKNIFGHRWVLKINESNDNLKKSRTKLIIYVLVFACIIIAVCFGILLSIEPKFFIKEAHPKKTPKQVPNIPNNITNIHSQNLSPLNNYENRSERVKESIKLQYETVQEESKNFTIHHSLCHNCNKNEEVCLNVVEGESPQCRKIVDKNDPTGCGGLCKLNKEYCKMLDAKDLLYQCRTVQNTLNCSNETFNCGNRCILSKLRCDGVIHCSNMSDEQNCECDLNTHFQCRNSTGCLELSKKCDGKIDCWDKSDEMNCNHGKTFYRDGKSCNKGEVPCHNGQCINKENICDGIYHCMDKSDEPKGCELHK